LYRKIESTRVLINPSKEIINRLDEFIRLTISGKITPLEKKEFNDLCRKFFRDNRLDVLILGCTELPLIFKNSKDIKVIDTIELLACRIVDTIK
jgi:aspartate/glutamate racemase